MPENSRVSKELLVYFSMQFEARFRRDSDDEPKDSVSKETGSVC
jgi:hypothetical protein